MEVSRQLLMNDLNQVSSVSLLMTTSTAPANEGHFELTRRPLSHRHLRKLPSNQVGVRIAEDVEESMRHVRIPGFNARANRYYSLKRNRFGRYMGE